MTKKVKAPKTYNPGGGRPIEHLAYLNRQEMDYLRAINNGHVSRGPKGLPSFAEESLAGPGGSKSGGGSGAGGGSSASSGTGGQGKTTSGTQSTTASKPAGFDRSQTMMTDANGVSYDYNGNVIKSATDPRKSNSAASPNFPSSVNLDRQIQNQTQIKDAIQAVKNTPAIKSSAPANGIKSINVGPMGTPVSIGGSPKVSTPASKPPEAKIGMSVPRGFYDGITTERENALREAQKQSERVSSGLFGKSFNDPRDVVSSPTRTDVSERYTPAEKQAALDSINPVKIAGRLSDAAVSAYNNPGAVVQGISQGIGALGNYLKSSYETIGAGALSSDPFEREAAVKASTDLALNFGMLGAPAGALAAPKNALGMWTGRMSQDPQVQRVLDLGENLARKGATPEDVYRETVEKAPEYMSGVMTLPVAQQRQMVELVEPLNMRPTNPLRTAYTTWTGDYQRLGDIITKDSPILKSYPEAADLPIRGSLRDILDEGGVLRGAYNPPEGEFLENIVVNYPRSESALAKAATQVKGKMNPQAYEQITGSSFRKTLGHELGHYIARQEGFPPGENPLSIAAKLAEKYPNMTKSQINDLAYSIYENLPGETYARLIQERVNLPSVVRRDYPTSFVQSVPQEDIRRMRSAASALESLWRP